MPTVRPRLVPSAEAPSLRPRVVPLPTNLPVQLAALVGESPDRRAVLLVLLNEELAGGLFDALDDLAVLEQAAPQQEALIGLAEANLAAERTAIERGRQHRRHRPRQGSRPLHAMALTATPDPMFHPAAHAIAIITGLAGDRTPIHAPPTATCSKCRAPSRDRPRTSCFRPLAGSFGGECCVQLGWEPRVELARGASALNVKRLALSLSTSGRGRSLC
jgi:hypothetical protein